MTLPAAQPSKRWNCAFRALAWLALAALALTPIVMDPAARDDAYMTPKWSWIAFWTGLGLIGVLAPALGGRELRFPLEPVWAAMLVWCLWHWVGILGAPSPSMGVERAMHVTWTLLAAVLAIQLLQRRHLRAMAHSLIGVTAVTAVWVLVEDCVRAFWPNDVWIRPNLADWRGYLGGGLGNTNHLGDLFALALIPALVMFGEARTLRARWALGFTLVLIPAALIVCFSVGSMIGLIIAALLMLGLTLKRTGGRWFLRRKTRWIVLLALWAFVVAFFVVDQPLNPHRPGLFKQAFSSQRLAEGGPSRLAIWAEGLEMIRLNPIAGFGTGNFTCVFPTMNSRLLWGSRLFEYQGMWTNAAHNELLQAWAEMGIVGLLALILVAALGFHSLLHRLAEAGHDEWLHRMTLAGMLAAICGHAQMNFVLQHPAGLLIFVATLAAISIEKTTRRQQGGAMPPLRWETDWCALRVEWLDMRKPTGLGFALLLPSRVALTIGLVLLAGFAGWWGPARFAPVRAQRFYRMGSEDEQRATALRMAGDAMKASKYDKEAETCFLRAIAIDPNCTNCRSHYAQWLVDPNRPQEKWEPKKALEQLDIVQKRLTAIELWKARARAAQALGEGARDEYGAAMSVVNDWHKQEE